MVRLVGGDLAVDFVNTVDIDIPGSDHVATPQALREWLEQVGLDDNMRPRDVPPVRATLDAVLRPLAQGTTPKPSDLDALRDLERAALGRGHVEVGGWRFARPLDQIVHAAVELLTHGPVERLKECGNCPWLFLDLSRNNSRRWCSMESCGTEVKIRRLTERRRVG